MAITAQALLWPPPLHSSPEVEKQDWETEGQNKEKKNFSPQLTQSPDFRLQLPMKVPLVSLISMFFEMWTFITSHWLPNSQTVTTSVVLYLVSTCTGNQKVKDFSANCLNKLSCSLNMLLAALASPNSYVGLWRRELTLHCRTCCRSSSLQNSVSSSITIFR